MYDGSSKELTTNIIAESMFTQVDYEVHDYQLPQEITDHRRDRLSMPKSDGMICSRNVNIVVNKAT